MPSSARTRRATATPSRSPASAVPSPGRRFASALRRLAVRRRRTDGRRSMPNETLPTRSALHLVEEGPTTLARQRGGSAHVLRQPSTFEGSTRHDRRLLPLDRGLRVAARAGGDAASAARPGVREVPQRRSAAMRFGVRRGREDRACRGRLRSTVGSRRPPAGLPAARAAQASMRSHRRPPLRRSCCANGPAVSWVERTTLPTAQRELSRDLGRPPPLPARTARVARAGIDAHGGRLRIDEPSSPMLGSSPRAGANLDVEHFVSAPRAGGAGRHRGPAEV